jgi:hypothetical protein
MNRISEERVNILMDRELKELAYRVARMRGETLSSMIRRALKKELASLNYLSSEEKKALGVTVSRVEKMKNSNRKHPQA